MPRKTKKQTSYLDRSPRVNLGWIGNLGAALVVPGIVLTAAMIFGFGWVGVLFAILPAAGIFLLVASDS